MTKRVLQTFSLTDEILQVLDEICKDTGMKRSVVVQELILKAGKDKKTRKIITNENYIRVARKKMGTTSHNVHCVNGQKNGSDRSHLIPEPAADSELLLLNNIRIAKTRWLEDNPGEE